MEAKAPFSNGFLCKKVILFSWCALYYFSAFPAAKKRSHFSIVPERRGLEGDDKPLSELPCQENQGYTITHSSTSVTKKNLFVIGSILRVLQLASLIHTVNRTQGTGFIFISRGGWRKRTTPWSFSATVLIQHDCDGNYTGLVKKRKSLFTDVF